MDKKYSISLADANIKSLVVVLPIAVMYILLISLVWGWDRTGHSFLIVYDRIWVSILVFIAGVFLHELLHGVTWMWQAKLGWQDVEYGFKLSALAPYAHCKIAISAKAYRWGIITPGILLGVVPYLIGLLSGDAAYLVFGFIFTLAAGGDFLMLWVIRDIPGERLVKDHPERVGCILAD